MKLKKSGKLFLSLEGDQGENTIPERSRKRKRVGDYS
jgi:hypothetical protein